MCNIWQVKDHDDCQPQHYRNIPNTLRHINISGGEPFLRVDLPEIVRVVAERNPTAHILVSSNGFQPSRTVEAVRKMMGYHNKLGVGISIDGIGAKHDGSSRGSSLRRRRTTSLPTRARSCCLWFRSN